MIRFIQEIYLEGTRLKENKMNIANRLKKMAGKMLDNRKNLSFSYAELNSFLNKFDNPKDNIERSFFQYKAQVYVQSKLFYILSNIAACLLYPAIVFNIKKYNFNEDMKYEVIFNCYDIDKEILPISIKKKYNKIFYNESMDGYLYDQDLLNYLELKLTKYKKYKFFYLKCVMKLAYYNYLIKKYNPKLIVGYSEFSFTSSILTDYCEYLKVEHINIMHGEKCFDVSTSFCYFHKFYIWADFYKDLFLELKIKANFIIELPEMFVYEKEHTHEIVDYTYYLTNQNGNALLSVVRTLKQLSMCEKKVMIRPHPRYTNIEQLKKICSDDMEIEENDKITIRESIIRTKAVISDFSTVLTQGLFADKRVIIDDITDPELFNKMLDLKYGIVYNKSNYYLLSEIMRGMTSKND